MVIIEYASDRDINESNIGCINDRLKKQFTSIALGLGLAVMADFEMWMRPLIMKIKM